MEHKERDEKVKSPEEIALKVAFGIDDNNLFDLVDLAKDFAVFKGSCMRTEKLSFDARIPVAFCLVPSSFPQQWFAFVKSIQQDLNYVLHKIEHSPKFLKSCLESVLEIDEFTAQIFQIYETVLREGVLQPISLGLLRSDYMLDTDTTGTVTGIKQIENNTIAASFGGLSPNVRELHVFILERLGIKDKKHKLPENEVNYSLAKGLVCAWDAYGNKRAVILFVVKGKEGNVGDLRALEFSMYEIENQVQVIRYTFPELRKSAVLRNNHLFVDGREVAVAYYRCGYAPSHYEPEDWEVRLLIERSLAIKCPTAAGHLAGSKTVQLHLALPGVLEKFVPENSDPARIRKVFTEQFSLKKGEEGDRAVALAIKNPHEYVLKPEREGGGNNYFGDDMKKLLESIASLEDRQAYMLMKKINPPHIPNCIVRASCYPKITNVLCELGIYGVIMGTKEKIHTNYEAGHVIRTKEVGLNEGGIAAGFGALDSPFLF